ncbi:MAG TPA: DinB family protein [Bryobacteraceae bacterium]|nr:DinB family protein [Bryobacteraceae bacterium]
MRIRDLVLFAISALPLAAANPTPGAREIFDRQLNDAQREVMNLVETMPADRYNFAPTQGAFAQARTFGVQARHIAFCLDEVAIALLGEKMLPHLDQEGPRNVTGKDDVVRYLKEAFAHAHRALGTLTNDNLLEPIADPYVEELRTTRLNAATIFLSHTWDHYGQMVEYLRMNNLTPPRHQ